MKNEKSLTVKCKPDYVQVDNRSVLGPRIRVRQSYRIHPNTEITDTGLGHRGKHRNVIFSIQNLKPV